MLRKFYTPATIFAVLLAVLVPLYFAYKAGDDLKKYDVVKLKITPYDPRDLMYGKYLQYTINWNWADEKLMQQLPMIDNACICLADGDTDPRATIQTCPTPTAASDPSCKKFVRGAHSGATYFRSDIERYYVDEKLATGLDRLFAEGNTKFEIGVIFPESGKARVESLYIDDMPLKDWIAEHGHDLPKDPSAEPIQP